MKELEERIIKDGILAEGNVLKVDSFLNHQLDPVLFNNMAKEWYRLFGHKEIDKIVTIETSGIALAIIAGLYFNVPVLFAKKTQSINLTGEILQTEVESFTHKRTNKVIVEKKFLNPGEKVLLIDDFLAEGSAMLGLIDLCNKAGAQVQGIGIAIEKGFQKGGQRLRATGIPVRSLAIVEADDGSGVIKFKETDLKPVL